MSLIPARLRGRWGRRSTTAVGATAGTVLLCVGTALALAAGVVTVGPRPDGTAYTPTGYRVTPAGAQITLGDLPLAAALSPDGRTLVVSNAGQGTQSVQVIDIRTALLVQSLPYSSPNAVYGGVAFAPAGDRVYVSGGGSNLVHVFTVAAGRLTEAAPLRLPTRNPAGAAINPFAAGLAITPDGRRLVVADQLADAVSVVAVDTGAVSTTAVGHLPYGVTLSADGSRAYVADQGGSTVSVVDVSGAEPRVTSAVTVGTHPNKSVLSADGRRLYVANGDSDTVSVLDTARNTVARTLSLQPYPGAAVGSNPTALALSADQRTLYVANAGNNDVAVLDLRRGRVVGMVPVGWYPTSVTAAGGRLWVTNAKGLGAGPNDGPGHPDPYAPSTAPDQYAGSMMRGTLSTFAAPVAGRQLDRWSAQVVANNGFDERGRVRAAAGSVIPRRVGQSSPIKHVIYVVRENRTYDQELGSLGRGNGEPALNLFGDDAAPNVRELSRRFVTFDNFYADAEVSAQGWNWAVAANSNPFAEQEWPANYSSRRGVYTSEAGDPGLAPNRNPADAYIWQRLAAAHVSFRNFGFYVNTNSAGVTIGTDPVLQAGTDPAFRGYDLSCPDSSGTFPARAARCGAGRVDTWLADFRAREASGQLPAVEFVRLPNDHTAGTRVGSPTPKAYVADNDYALGRLVDAVSHSRFWNSTAIFVTEDDAQDGPDHVDAHRTVALAISPYTQTGRVDSTFYSTASMLRTVELVAGIGPLTQFDAFAAPMSRAFTDRPNRAPYSVLTPTQSFTETNSATAPLAAESGQQDLGREDRIDTATFNRAIWLSVRGAGAAMPAPQHRVYGAAGGPDD
jgi:YVTN family beta-propeller protein